MISLGDSLEEKRLNYIHHLHTSYKMNFQEDCDIKIDFTSSEEDWVFEPSIDGDGVLFNTYLEEKSGDEYFLSILIHEFFHISQCIYTKSEVQVVKKKFHPSYMTVFDIEADYYTAKYFHYRFSYTFEDFIGTLYQGRKIFPSSEFKIDKFVRFLGSTLSIRNFFTNGDYKLYLPQLIDYNPESEYHFVVDRGTRKSLLKTKLQMNEYNDLKNAHDPEVEMSEARYIEILNNFSSRVIDLN